MPSIWGGASYSEAIEGTLCRLGAFLKGSVGQVPEIQHDLVDPTPEELSQFITLQSCRICSQVMVGVGDLISKSGSGGGLG